MKFTIVIAAICMASVVLCQQTQDQGRLVADLLATRGQLLLNNTRATVLKLYQEGKGPLASAVEHQVVLVEALVLDLKAQVANLSHTHAVHHLHVIEEELLHLENRISEELYIITHLGDNHIDEHQGSDPATAKLIAHANSVIFQALEALKNNPHAREANEINAEIMELHKLIKALQAEPSTSTATYKQEATQLARHEQTLEQLVARATRHSHPIIPVTQAPHHA